MYAIFRIAAALAVGVVLVGCSSGGAKTTAVSAASAPTPGVQSSQAMEKCLKKYGLSRASLKVIFNSTAADPGPYTAATLKQAGTQCWVPSSTGLFATGLTRIDSCLKVEGVATEHTGSPLADVLLAMDDHAPKVRTALKFCLRT